MRRVPWLIGGRVGLGAVPALPAEAAASAGADRVCLEGVCIPAAPTEADRPSTMGWLLGGGRRIPAVPAERVAAVGGLSCVGEGDIPAVPAAGVPPPTTGCGPTGASRFPAIPAEGVVPPEEGTLPGGLRVPAVSTGA